MNLTRRRGGGHLPADRVPLVRDGRLPVPTARVTARTVLIAPDVVLARGEVGVYARVSSYDRRGDLGRPPAELVGRAALAAHPLVWGEAVAGSGMNQTRPAVRRHLVAPATAAATVKDQDRDRDRDRDRPGQVTTALAGAAHGGRLAVLAACQVAGGLVRDRTGVLTSCGARRPGRGPARNRPQNALRRAARAVGPSHPLAAA